MKEAEDYRIGRRADRQAASASPLSLQLQRREDWRREGGGMEEGEGKYEL
jgi:hypothetical protein